MKHPAILFYVGDWRKDLGIQSLSFHDRGVWFELLMLMHCSEQRGRLVLAGKPMPNSAVARLLGLSEQDVADTIATLVANGVASLDQDGTLINRRMVREEERRHRLRESGSKGGSITQAKREACPEYVNESDGLKKVRDFCTSESISLADADWFFWKCHANGWKNGGRPILDWKATLRSWKRAAYLPSQKGSRGGFSDRKPDRGMVSPPTVLKREVREPTEEEFKTASEAAKKAMEEFRRQLGR